MKILRVSFLNINSLAGPWTIDFESPEFRSEAFVVTGPTGAGKTSLLDAVALAIYGRTARQNSFSKESNPVMSEGTADCVAEADFIGADGGRYRARWEQHRANSRADGALQDITRVLYRNPCGADPGTLLEKGNERATAAIAEKAGLTYNQFVRAVVLQQGDFASFLEAKKEQRADLLEKAVRDARFSEAGRKVFAAWHRADEERRRAETILLERIGLASAGTDGKKRKPSQDDIEKQLQAANAELEENKKSLEERRRAAEADSARLAGEIASLQTEKNWVEAENKLREKEEDLQDRRTEVGDLEREFAADRPVYETAVRARALDAAHAPLADARRKRGEAAERRERYVQEKKTAEGTVGTREGALADERKKKDAVDTACAEKRAIIAQADAIDKKLHAAEKLVEAAKTAEKSALEAAKKSEDAATAAEKTATRAESLAAAAAAWKPGDPVPSSYADEPVFKALVAAAAADAKVRTEETKVETAQSRFDEAKKKADALRADEKKGANSELKVLRAAEEEAKNAFDGLKWALELSDQRALLKEGDSCPLCGATYHVSAVPPDLARTVADAEQKWKDATTARETKETEQKAVRDAETNASQALVQAQADLAKVRERTDQDKQNGPLELQKAATGAKTARRTATDKRGQATLERTSATAKTDDRKRLEEERNSLRDDFEKLLGEQTVDQAREEVDQAEEDARRLVSEAETKLAAAKATVTAKEQAIATEDQAVKTLDGTIATEEKRFHDALSGSFADEAEWSAARLDDKTFSAHKAKADDIGDRNAEIKILAASLEKSRTEQDAAKPVDKPRTAEELEGLLEEKTNDKTTADQKKGAADREFAELESKELKRAKARTDWETARDLYEKWTNLNHWFGGEKGNEFRVYAQGITLGRLLLEANPPLLAMTGNRYELDWDGADGNLMPVAVDHWQARERRAVSNLSGGETFLVSLSLALGLGRLAGKDLSIETLFLDEGFGTLDDEKLQLALKTLSDLRGAGCTVGVISHVEAVKTHGFDLIEVTPRGDSTSTLAGPGVSATGPAPFAKRARASKAKATTAEPAAPEP